MYRRFTFIDAYREFMYKENISLSSFKKYVPHNIKKPHRLSDLCAYCQLNKVYKYYVFQEKTSRRLTNDHKFTLMLFKKAFVDINW